MQKLVEVETKESVWYYHQEKKRAYNLSSDMQ